MNVGDLIATTAELRQLPPNTEFVSEPDCLWPNRYAGVRWRKGTCNFIHRMTVDGLGRQPGKTVSAVAYFKDPLPARIVLAGKEKDEC